MRTFNNEGSSPFSPPVFIYVGYSIPKRKILNVLAEARSSSSISVQWDPWINDSDVISGFKIRYVPVTSVISDSSHDEDMVIVENNSCLINDLRKYTDYQISITPYNRAGEGAVSQLRVRTLEDIPGPVGQLRFTDVLLDSVHVSWDPPVQPNGVVTGYIVNYRTFKMQSRTQQTFYPAAGLEQGVTYFFAVWAETAVGRGTESTGNITVGSNPEWKDTIPHARIIGHLIQTKRISKAMVIYNIKQINIYLFDNKIKKPVVF
uniref:Fibronectin type-III domain-containing protein n=1 Tax=Heterorhabditis bacteriophora TaxID=37862 RepID=A0A1I7W993_HETBA